MARTTQKGPAASFGHANQDRANAEYATGQDVGHGVDHDCPQCRVARKQLVSMGLGSALETPTGSAPSDVMPGSAADDTRAAQVLQDNTSTPIAETGVFTDTPPGTKVAETRFDPQAFESEDGVDPGSPEGDRSAIVRVENPRYSQIAGQVAKAFGTVMTKLGVPEGYAVEYDTMLDVLEHLKHEGRVDGIMLMQGYVPEDARWHVEIMAGGRRAHVKFIDREIAMMVALVSLFDGRAGAALERSLEEFNKPSAVAYHTGATQAAV